MRVLRFLFFIGLAAIGAVVILVSNRGPDTTSVPSTAIQKGTFTTTFRTSLGMLRVVPEDRRTYARSLFGEGWADLDRDCQDTRAEVLARESLVRVTKGCRVYRGEWLSYYDNKWWTRSFEVQIDHLVPLAEAWDSGAFAWNAETRLRYANDLGDRRALVPTTTALNYAKLAADPQWFIPKVNGCRYISSWIAVKLRWNLAVDRREHEAIAKLATSCPDEKVTVTPARTAGPVA